MTFNSSSNFLNVKIVSALRIGTGRVFHNAGPDIEKNLDPVFVFKQGKTDLFETSGSARYAGWLYFRARKVIADILK